jgi:hypothetical protein
MAEVYDVGEVLDKALVTNKRLPYYTSPPNVGYNPQPAGYFDAGENAGTVYSYLDADPTKNRSTLWWIFYPGTFGSYYYMPHHVGDFNIEILEGQGAESEFDKNATWYEKVLKQVLPVVAIAILGGALIKGYFSSKSRN